MRLWRKRDELLELERELRARRPEPRHEFARALEQRVHRSRYRRPAPAFRLGLAAAVTAAMVVALAAVGGLSYAASGVTQVAHVASQLVQPQAQTGPAAPNAAAQQYGKKALVCAVQPNGKQHTISISRNAVPSYLAHHHKAYLGACNPRATPNVCVKMTPRKVAPVWVPPAKVRGYLARNPGSYRAKKGKC